MSKLLPLVLSGGAGTRLWPVSREGHPKPFIKLPDGQSLLSKTYQRALGLDLVTDVLTVTNRDYYFGCKDELADANGHGARHAKGLSLLEPFGRNTAPAIALGALWARAQFGADTLLLVLPSDHLIQDTDAFGRDVGEAAHWASQGLLVTFGIPATAPETGFGYIEQGEPLGEFSARRIRRFTEKPTLETAREFVASGRYLWNSGMFCFAAGVFLDQLQQHSPELYQAVLGCWEAISGNHEELSRALEIDPVTFAEVPDISVDYAVMERSSAGVVIPATFDWSDIGSWNALGNLLPQDGAGNRLMGESVLVDVTNSLVQSEDRLVAAIGIDGLVIVDTPDALLVAHQDRVQDVRQVVHQLKRMEHQSYLHHRTVFRPWGSYTVLEESRNFKIKRLEIRPGAALSLQLHHHRSEHWVVVSGMAKVVNGEREILVDTNESTFIPAGHRHRVMNPGLVDLVLIEVQSGAYLGEDDIVRFDDQYGRV